MSDFDLDRLGDVWRQQPDPAEMERLQRTAAAVSRRARWAHLADLGTAVLVAAIVIVLVISNPRAGTVVMGAAAIAVLLLSHLRQRKLRAVELKELAGSTEEMIEQSINRVETAMKRNRFTLIGFTPSLLIGVGFASAVDDRGGIGLSVIAGDSLWTRAILIAVVVVAGTLFLVRALRINRREHEYLVAMREAYRRERESSGV